MERQDPFEVKKLSGETINIGHCLTRVTIAIAHHVVDPNVLFHEPVTYARSLLSGLSKENPLFRFRDKYHNLH